MHIGQMPLLQLEHLNVCNSETDASRRVKNMIKSICVSNDLIDFQAP